MSDFETAKAAATKAYTEEYRKHGVNFASPVTSMKDRIWSEMLRAAWPDHASVEVKNYGSNKPNYTEMRRWCNEKSNCSYWTNGGGSRWYFERKDIAAMFKLTFGGAQ